MLGNFKPYHTWHARLAQLVPQNCRTRLVNMSLLIAGLYHARNVHLSAIVRKWPLAGHQLWMVAIAYRRRALPLAWCWVKGKKGHSGPSKQLALLSYVRGLLPPHTPVLLVGDSEFGSVGVLRQLEAWHWRFVLRQPGNTLVRPNSRGPWRRFDRLVQRPGECGWGGGAARSAPRGRSANTPRFWGGGGEEPRA